MDTKFPEDNTFACSLRFLKKFNSLSVKGRPVSEVKIFSKYNVWIFFQTRLFFNDLKDVHKRLDNFTRPNTSLRIKVQDLILAVSGLLSSLVAILVAIVWKKKIMVYSIDRANSSLFDNDARMDPVYKYLKESGVPFIETFHTIFDRAFVQNFFIRKRFAIYVKSIDLLFPLACFLGLAVKNDPRIGDVDFSAFEPEERGYAKFLLSRYLGSVDLVTFRVRVLAKVLSWIGLEALFTIDNTRDYWELVLACRMNDIPVYAFQHGHFTKYHVGWLFDSSFTGEIVCPNKLFVWSDFWKKELLRLGTYFPEESIEVGGFMNPVNTTVPRSNGKEIAVLIPYETGSIKSEVKKYLDKLLWCENTTVFFKVRTDMARTDQLSEYGIHDNYHRKLVIVSDVKDCILETSIVAGTYSTFLYDMVVYEKPVVILRTSSDFGDGLLENSLADEVNLDNLCNRIAEISKTPEHILKERKKALFGEEGKLMYDSVKQLGEEIYLGNKYYDTKN